MQNFIAKNDEKAGLFARLKQGLKRTSGQLGEGVGRLFLGKKEIDEVNNYVRHWDAYKGKVEEDSLKYTRLAK